MKKIITEEQIQTILNTFYGTNISAKDYNAVIEFFNQLPEIKEVEKEVDTKPRTPIKPRK